MNDTKTPRTDAEATQSFDSGLRSAFVVHVEFARELEREIARITAERDEAVREAAQARQTIYRLQHELAGCSRAPADGKHTPAGETFIPEAL